MKSSMKYLNNLGILVWFGSRGTQNAPLIMISLKRNSKKQLVEATGIRTRKSSIYNPGQSEDFKISRSKFDDFKSCQRCFYLNIVNALISPSNRP